LSIAIIGSEVFLIVVFSLSVGFPPLEGGGGIQTTITIPTKRKGFLGIL
jgi:hypothetical protein